MGLRRLSSLPLFASAGAVLVVDLATKALAVQDPARFGAGVIHNPELPHLLERALVIVATVIVIALLSLAAQRRGIGPIPAVWVAGGLLVGGVLGNGISGVIWRAGVPDFIDRGARMWNLADFSIGLGMLLFLISTTGYVIRAAVLARPRS